MKHYTEQQWVTYVQHAGSVEEYDPMEKHLADCEACMELYIQCLERAAEQYPALRDEASLADKVMLAIETAEQLQLVVPISVIGEAASNRQKPIVGTWMRHPLFHYMVAAVITLVLMSSGVFQSLIDRSGPIDLSSDASAQTVPQNEPVSVSQKLLDQTIVMLDAIQPKYEKGGIR